MKPLVHKSVCAVVGSPGEPVRRALASAPGAPQFVVEATRLRAGLERALASGADWIWVLDGSAVPRPDALATLLAGLDRADGLPAPSLLTGVIVGPDGRVAADRPPWYRRYKLHIAVEAADRALLPVRGSVGPTLVSRAAVETCLPPANAPVAPGAVLEWTATLLRERTGYLVPESESETAAGARDPLRSPAMAARLILGRAVTRPDRVGLILELAERAGRRPSVGGRP